MSLYRVGDPFGFNNDGIDGDGLTDEQRALLAVLMGDHENDKLYQIMCNYLALAQFELARSVLDQLFTLSPERVVHVLRTLVFTPRPQKWLFSEQVPNGAHLAWLAYMEYKYSCKMIPKAVDSSMWPDQETRSAWLKLLNKYEKMKVNPLGFVSHDRFQINIIEATTLKVFEKKEYAEHIPPLSFRVSFELEGKQYNTQEIQNSAVDPRWNRSFAPIEIYFADSKIKFAVYARRVLRDNLDQNEEELIGIATLPLYQLRNKEEYHIWLPLESPEPDAPPNPFTLPKQPGVGLSQVAKPNFGKIRIKINWIVGEVGVGELPFKLVQALESDLLIYDAIYNGHSAYHAANRKFTAGMSLKVPPTGLLIGRYENIAINGDLIQNNKPLLTPETVNVLRNYVNMLLDNNIDDKNNELIQLVQSHQHPDEYLLRNTDNFYHEIRNLMWTLPTTAYALCAKLTYLENVSIINKRYQLSSLHGPSKMESTYAQIITEMLMKKEFSRASMAAYHFVHDIYPHPKRYEAVDIVLNAFLTFIHDNYQETETLQRTLQQLLRQANIRRLERGNEENIIDLGIIIDDSLFKDDDLELYQFSNEYTVRKYQETLLMQSQVYSSLLGTPHEFTLRRFCSLEDQYLYGTPITKNQLPSCFMELERALNSLHKVADTLTKFELEQQQKQCLLTFYGSYLSYIRVTNKHIFEYPVKKALGYCKSRDWSNANLVLLPFSELRPLVVLLAWDEFEDEYYARENMIIQLWRYRPIYPNEPCHEPRLIEWCNRLDFSVTLITAVLDYLDKRAGIKQPLSAAQLEERNDKAIRLLDTLRLHSFLYAFRDYLSDLSPTVLINTLEDKTPIDRGIECNHDIHVLRSYYSIHGIMGTILNSLSDPLTQHPELVDSYFSVDEKVILKEVDNNEENNEMKKLEEKEGNLGSDDNYSDENKTLNEGDIDNQLDNVRVPKSGNAEITVLKALQKHLLSMNKAEFQVTTLEKMFCLIFMQEEDILLDDDEKIKLNIGSTTNKNRNTNNNNNNDDDDNDTTDNNNITNEKETNNDTEEDEESPLVLDDVDSLIAYLKFMLNTCIKLSAQMSALHKHNPSPRDATDIARVEAIKLHVNETLWRMSVLKEKGLRPTLSLLSAPMESISTIFLKMDNDNIDTPLRQPNMLGNQMIAERWRQLCKLVRDRARTRPQDIVSGVIDFISNYYKDPETTLVSDDNTNPGIMQGFFFAMDVVIVFNHILSAKQVQNLVDYALSFLQATKASHETPEAIDLYLFFMAYAKHCRFHNRKRFELKSMYELAEEDTESLNNDAEPNVLTMWVHAYRLTQQAKNKNRPDMILRNGWLTSDTNRLEDEVTAREYPLYVNAYYEYCQELGVSSISEALINNDGEIIQPSNKIYHSPWHGFEVLQFLTKISVGAKQDHFAMKAAWDKAIKDKQRDSILNNEVEQNKTPSEIQAEVQERLEVISQRMTVLGRLLLPSLSAVRYSLRFAPEDAIPLITKFAREQSTLFPTYERFINWRASVYENALQLLTSENNNNDIMLSQDIRSLFAYEDVEHDQQAYLRLLADFLKNEDLTVEQKKIALEMADTVINTDADPTHAAESQIQTLLLTLIEDENLREDTVRASCILRLKDIVWAAQMAIKFINEWDDVDLCSRVLLKCVSDLSPAHPLRPKVAIKYNIVLIFQEIKNNLKNDTIDIYLKESKKINNFSSQQRLSIQHIFNKWQTFEYECKANISFVLLRLLDVRLTKSAQMLFELYKKGRALSGEGFEMSMDKKLEIEIEERIEAALIAELFAPDPLTGLPSAPARKRIEAMQRIEKIAPLKKFNVIRHMIESLPGAQSRFIVVEYLRRFIKANDDAKEVQDELEREKEEGVIFDDYALGNADDETLDLMQQLEDIQIELNDMSSVTMDIQVRQKRQMLQERLKDLQHMLESHREALRRQQLRTLPPKEIAALEAKVRKREKAKKIEQIIEFTEEQRRWINVMNTSVRILMILPYNERKSFEDLYRNPRDLVLALLNKGKIKKFDKVMKIFGNYDGSVIDYQNNVKCELLTPTIAEKERGIKSYEFNSYRYILRFAEDVLTLQRNDMGKDTGFQIFDLCTNDNEHLHVAEKCLDIVNNLSSHLSEHEHALFLVHLMKNILTYFKVKLEVSLRGKSGFIDIFTRYQEYRNLIFTREELQQIDNIGGGNNHYNNNNTNNTAKKLPLVYALRRVQFCIDDLRDPMRARKLRERLIRLDKLDLAQRVWEECELQSMVDDESRKQFEDEMKKQMNEVKQLCEEFDAKSNNIKRKGAHVVALGSN